MAPQVWRTTSTHVEASIPQPCQQRNACARGRARGETGRVSVCWLLLVPLCVAVMVSWVH